MNLFFLDFRDPSRLKHKVAAIEGVIAIKISAAFLIAPSQAEPGAARCGASTKSVTES